MQQASAAPDAVERLLPGDVLKTQVVHRLADLPRGQREQGRGGVEGGHGIAALREGRCIAPGAATGVEDLCLVPQQREEAAIKRSDVDFDGIVEEGISVPLIVSAA